MSSSFSSESDHSLTWPRENKNECNMSNLLYLLQNFNIANSWLCHSLLNVIPGSGMHSCMYSETK